MVLFVPRFASNWDVSLIDLELTKIDIGKYLKHFVLIYYKTEGKI